MGMVFCEKGNVMSKKRLWALLAGSAGLALLTGCGFLAGVIGNVIQPSTTTILLVNNSDFPVEVTLYYDNEQEIPEALLTEIGTEIQQTVGVGETFTINRDCDDLQAVIIDDAELSIIGEVGPGASTGVYRDGDDFNCGDTLTFTFDHTAVIVDFDISVSISGN